MSVSVNFSGHDVRTIVPDGTGIFYAPVVSKISDQVADIYVRIDDFDFRIPEPVEFDMASIWGARIFRVSVTELEPGKFTKPQIMRHGGNWLYSAVSYLSPWTEANAQEVMTFDAYKEFKAKLQTSDATTDLKSLLPSANVSVAEQQIVEGAVLSAAQATSEWKASSTLESFDMRKLSIDDISAFNSIVTEKSGLTIAPENWQYIENGTDATIHLKSLKSLGTDSNGIVSMGEASRWSNFERAYMDKTGRSLVVVPNVLDAN
jgi:hypothetical protein